MAEAIPYISGGSGFTLSYQTSGDSLLVTPIIGSSVELPMHIRDDNRDEIEQFIEDIVSSDEDRFTVLIYEDSNIYWRGKIQPEQIQIPDRYYTEISIFAADGLGRLASIPYNDNGTVYEGWETFQGHLHNIIDKLGLYDIDPGNELGIVQNWTVTDIDGRFPESIRVQHEAFLKIKGDEIIAYDCQKVLKHLLERFQMRIIQQDGIFFVEQINYLAGTGNKTCIYYDNTGAYNSTTSGTTFNTSVLVKLSGGLTFFMAQAKSVEADYAYKDSIQGSNLFIGLLINGNQYNIGLIPTGNGEVVGFGFDFYVEHTKFIGGTILFNVLYEFIIQQGTYYLSGDGVDFEWVEDPAAKVIIRGVRQIKDWATTNFTEGIGFIIPSTPESGEVTFYWDYSFCETGDPNTPVVPEGITSVTSIRNEARLIYAVGSPNEGTNITQGTSGNLSGEVIELPELIIGDLPYLRSVGRIQKYDGAEWINTDSDWGVSTVEDLNIDVLLVREAMALQKTPVRLKSLILRSDVNVANKLNGEIIMTASYTANQNQWAVECFTPVIDRTGITYTTFTEIEDQQNSSKSTYVETTIPSDQQTNYIEQSDNILKPVNKSFKFDQVAQILIIDEDIELDETHYTILADTTSGAVDVLVPEASDHIGRSYRIRRWTGTNDLTVTPSGYNSIIGSVGSYALVTIENNGEWIEIMSNGTDWYIVQDNPII